MTRKFISLALACALTVGAFAQGSNQTFATLIDNALFLQGGADAYKAFGDEQIKVVKVTNLDKDGEGSLTWAVRLQEPRIVVFEVGGVIDLDGMSLKIINPYIYIAGQTAPAPGITIIKGELQLQSHDIVIRHIAVRPGDGAQAKKSGWEMDGMSAVKGWNVLVDHCSCTWATDEGLSASGPRHDGKEGTSRFVTFSNNIIAEAIDDGPHGKGPHAFGTLIHDYCNSIGVVRNLYASNQERNPLLKPNAEAYIANNLIYNARRRGIHSGMVEKEYVDHPGTMLPAKLTAIGNVGIYGPNTPANFYLIFGPMISYLKDNVMLKAYGDTTGDRTKYAFEKNTPLVDTPPVTGARYEPIPAEQVVESVMANVGARPWDRSPIDRRIVDQIRTGEGKLISSQDEVGGYPSLQPTSRKLNVPAKGIEKWVNDMAKMK